MLAFEPISLSRQQEYLALKSASSVTASDYSFINLWAWAEEYGLSWAWENGLVWIKQTRHVPCLWAPVGPWDGVSWAEVFHKAELSGLGFTRVPEDLLFQWVAALPGRVQAEEARELWDYLYSVSELVELSGNKFHSKKNHLNQFKKKYHSTYNDITPAIIHTVLAMQEEWCAWRDCESVDMLSSENRCIRRVLDAWEDLSGIRGAVISVDDKPVAFTVAEALREDTLLIHFEKGLSEYSGIYQAINQMFLEQNRTYSVVNREQDLGDEGLRNAKLSYNPKGFVRKYRVRIT
jgi:uncharacterized protein